MIKRDFSSISLYPNRKGGKKKRAKRKSTFISSMKANLGFLSSKSLEEANTAVCKGKIQLHSSDDPFDSIKEKLNCLHKVHCTHFM